MWKLFEIVLAGGSTRIRFARIRRDCRKLYPDAVEINEIVIRG